MEFLILFSLFTIVPIWAATQVARQKNISSLGPILLVMFLSWFGFVIVLALPNRSAKPEIKHNSTLQNYVILALILLIAALLTIAFVFASKPA